MAKRNLDIFNKLKYKTIEIKNIIDIEKVDALIFPSCISIAIKHYF